MWLVVVLEILCMKYSSWWPVLQLTPSCLVALLFLPEGSLRVCEVIDRIKPCFSFVYEKVNWKKKYVNRIKVLHKVSKFFKTALVFGTDWLFNVCTFCVSFTLLWETVFLYTFLRDDISLHCYEKPCFFSLLWEFVFLYCYERSSFSKTILSSPIWYISIKSFPLFFYLPF